MEDEKSLSAMIGIDPLIEDEIKRRLAAIELEYDVNILYACESGSRAWGFASQDSDYDVRFLYIKPVKQYLALEKQRDVIEAPIEGVYDINGWDIKKALLLLRQSNPTVIEWLHSPVIYRKNEAVLKSLRSLSEDSVNLRALGYHYRNMANNNVRQYKEKGKVTAKKYLYIVRPLLCNEWIRQHGTIPPVNFSEMCAGLSQFKQLPVNVPTLDNLLEEVRGLLLQKAKGQEKDTMCENECLDSFIQYGLSQYVDFALPSKPNWDGFNALFLSALGQFQLDAS